MKEMSGVKRNWKKPELTLLFRGTLAERVLCHCKVFDPAYGHDLNEQPCRIYSTWLKFEEPS